MFRQIVRTSFGFRSKTLPLVSSISSVKSTIPISRRLLSTNKKKDDGPKVRYLFYTFFLSTALLVLVSSRVEKKTKPVTNFSEKDFEEREEISNLKRRHKIVPANERSKVKFYVLPYVHDDETVNKLATRDVFAGTVVKVLDPAELLEQERTDESRRYSFLLQDLAASGKPLPKGLITGVLKNRIEEYLKQEQENLQPTTFLIKNYPQSTDEAIKFENDISDITRCISYHFDFLNELPKRDEEFVRQVNNVIGYFDTVGKSKVVTTKHDEMDQKLIEIALQDI
ncbi:hypothetical protein CAAN1_14S04324 [[Candida] anglica]|uniref:Altered inheritance of mitochondria protein 36, mitochondrial n=1 Tax=[Candida] anglica TaxID=148631 RepID=A0ABP0EMY1_9ASCO